MKAINLTFVLDNALDEDLLDKMEQSIKEAECLIINSMINNNGTKVIQYIEKQKKGW